MLTLIFIEHFCLSVPVPIQKALSTWGLKNVNDLTIQTSREDTFVDLCMCIIFTLFCFNWRNFRLSKELFENLYIYTYILFWMKVTYRHGKINKNSSTSGETSQLSQVAFLSFFFLQILYKQDLKKTIKEIKTQTFVDD